MTTPLPYDDRFDLATSSAVLDSMADAVLIIGRDGRIRRANRAAATLFGHPLGRLAGLPLADLGLAEIQMVSAPSLLDRAWTESTRYVFDGSHEWHYVVFPFLDYWLHFRGQPSPEWGLFGYLRRRLELSGPRDFLVRTWRKLGRMLRYRWR